MRAARRRVAVVTDSTAALPVGAAERWGITVVPLDVVVDGHRFAEGVSLAPDELVAALRRGAAVSTSQPAPEAFARAYARAAAAGAESVVSVHLSGELSGTVAAAHSAAERAPLPVHVVDSRTAAMALGSAALAAAWTAAGVPSDERFVVPPAVPAAAPARRTAEGASLAHRRDAGAERLPGGASSSTPLPDLARGLDAAREAARPHASDAPRATEGRHLPEWWHVPDGWHLPAALRRPAASPPPTLPGPDEVAEAARAAAAAARVWFLVDSLEHLRRGGRLSGPAAALGTVLGLRPLLTVSDGRVVVAEKIRTRRAARARLEAVAVAAAAAHGPVRLVVHHLGEAEAAAELAARIAHGIGSGVRETIVTEAGAVLGAHVGPGLVAVVVAPV